METVFILDDDKELTDLLVEFLSDFKFHLEVFHEPVKALEFLRFFKVSNSRFLTSVTKLFIYFR